MYLTKVQKCFYFILLSYRLILKLFNVCGLKNLLIINPNVSYLLINFITVSRMYLLYATAYSK